MSVLVTMMKKSMIGKPGYIQEFSENIVVFDKCLKVQAKENQIQDVKKWVCFIEGTESVIIMDVLLSRLSTGYVQAFIYNKDFEVKNVKDIGAFNTKAGHWYISELYEGRLVTKKELVGICSKSLLDQYSTSKVQVQVQSKKPVQKDKKYKESLNNMSPERLAELKRQIFGN